MRTKRFSLLAILLIAALVFAACGAADQTDMAEEPAGRAGGRGGGDELLRPRKRRQPRKRLRLKKRPPRWAAAPAPGLMK